MTGAKLNTADTEGSSSAVAENRQILVIEDEVDIARLIELHLKDRYQTVAIALDGISGLARAEEARWDLIILDLRLPGMDGLELCRRLRANQHYVPILMLTSKSSELDQVLGLEMGADDYVTKPFSVLELMSRVKAILRRVDLASAPDATAATASSQLQHGGLAVDTAKRTVAADGRSADLTAREFDLLVFLMRNPGEVFSRAQLLDKVWGYGHAGYEHTVNSHINRLRAKIEQDPTRPNYLVTVWGVGYKLADNP